MQILVLSPGVPNRTVTIDRLPYSIGRATDNDLALADPEVSGHHGQFVATSAGMGFVDLASRNGTRLNGQRISPNVVMPLAVGDRVLVGARELVVISVSAAAATAVVPAAPERREHGLRLVLEAADQAPRKLDFESGAVTVGRAPDNGLVLSDPEISSHHGRFVATADGPAFIDLGSRNGTRLNGNLLTPHQPAALRAGDRLRLGGSELVVEYSGASRGAEPSVLRPEVAERAVAAPPFAPHDESRGSRQESRPPEPPFERRPVKKSRAGCWLLAATVTVAMLCACACVASAGVLLVARGDRTTTAGRIGGGGGGTPPAPAESKTGRDGMVQIRIAAGEFTMGSENGEIDELPVRRVNLPQFYIDRTKITVEQFARFAGSNKVQGKWSRDANGKSPAVGVTFADAQAYCKSVARRLPTEAEWEKAARGTDGRRYPWGDEWDIDRGDFGNLKDSSSFYSYDKIWGPVGGDPDGASPYGVLDMAGGPKEWVSDSYAPYPGAPKQPISLSKDRYRVTRGGFRPNNFQRDLRASARGFHLVDVDSPDIGFRCAE